MSAKQWFLLFLMAGEVLRAIVGIILIGVEREPRTKADAIASVLGAAGFITLTLLWVW